MNDETEHIGRHLTERPSWVIVGLVGLPLHAGLVFAYFNVFSWANSTITYIAVIALATFVAGKLGRVHGVGSWIASGLIVGVAPYVALVGLYILLLGLTAGDRWY